ncbi:Crp/Fnr family transcriptional regulator [Thermodesulfobacteriota bacterium]
MTSYKLLAQIPLLKNLAPEDLEELGTLFRELKVNKGDVLFRKGSEGTALYIIQEGVIKIVLPSRLGDERIVAIFSAGDFFGEMALLDGIPRSADAVAIKPSKLLLLNRSDFLRFLKQSEAAIEKILSSLSMRLRKTDDLLEEASFLNIPARLAKKLLEIGEAFGHKDGEATEIHLKLSQKELADMVGATRESINKELRVLREKGLVSITEKAIYIHDIKRLKRRAR